MREFGRKTGPAACLLLLSLSLWNPAEASAQWATPTPPGSPNDIVNTNSGNVGIGTTTPGTKLEVRKDVSGDLGPILTLSNGAGYANAGGALDFSNPSLTVPQQARIRALDANDWSAHLGFFTRVPGPGGNVLAERVRITSGGLVGIGTSAPASLLHLSGAVRPALTISDPTAARARLSRTTGTQSDFAHNVTYDGTGWQLDDAAAGGSSISLGADFVGINQWTAGAGYRTTTTPLYINSSGAVGIGTVPPGASYKLDVAGSVRAAGFCLGGVCKSNWSEVGGQSHWAGGASNTISYNGGNVGIGVGTGTPVRGLHVAGANYTAGPEFVLENTSMPANGRKFNLWGDSTAGAAGRFYLRLLNDAATASSREFLTFDNATGMVGVGTTAPGAGLTDPTVKLDVAGSVNVSGSINAKYQDVAEWVPSVQKLAAGTVVVLDTRRSNHVVASTAAYDTRVAGVVSARPGIALGEAGEGKALVATTGRVKVKVDATRAPVRIGDLIVTSDVEGAAMRSEPVNFGGRQMHAPGTIIGKALEPLESGVGEILVLLSLQ